MADRITSLIQGGVTNAVVGTALETYLSMDPTTVHQYFNDFDVYTSGDWTGTATGSVTNAIVAGNGGILSMLNSASSADLNQLTLKAATFAFATGVQVWFKTRFNVSSASNAQIAIGLQNLNTAAFSATDGVWFEKDAASTALKLIVAASSTSTTSTVSQTMANTTYVTAGFYYDGGTSGTIAVYFNDTLAGNVVTTNLPASTTNLALTIAELNGTAAAITTLVDYVMVGVQRDTYSQIGGS